MANSRDRHGAKENLLEMGGNNGVHRENENMRLERKKMETVILNDDRSPSDHGEGLEEPLEENSDDSDSVAESHVSHNIDPNSFKGKLAAFLKTNVIQYSVVALVIADLVVIVLELLIEMEIIVFPENAPDSKHNSSSFQVNFLNHTGGHTHITPHGEAAQEEHEDQPNLWNSSLDGYNSTGNSSHHGVHHHHTNKEKAEHVLHALSLAILSIFMVEVSLKIFIEGKHLLKQPAEVFDAIVVIVSFTLDVVFSFVSVTSVAQDAAGFMVILRLWRVTRIINGVILSVKLDAKKKIDAMKRTLRHSEHENKKLRSKVEKLERKLKVLREKSRVNDPRELKSLKKERSVDNQVHEINSPGSFIFENNLHEIELRDLSDKI
ncbi:voltage-gated hydrogen channel 1-like isoform X1 [Biomphalaria glabrata]|uniref:Voltage-gated hydrogen channel 1 n=1 Tax=Biomphalaria glabrata TaxID=6526 RepID=A0A9W2Z963_BIOGL|nr:voltage-gated hydrogen channel 1-like isoform X1 [Biomphalaria glabrata]XP_055871434.1 voltage-gated hydrogen channel 1-like isoform X1 [Biomphalaria glabrata]XP_055871441.1 voltage-gated hydrogen channel 1-like isoform X1 [Biomphalaria glabrata]XP_055871449.1 voltage-gated hydrogen channel 1-like isoform X1 [Biomphalaria glabrata]XP_055871456.1 voltage-gated hydrogen channel 1-like isoform X1 [Biomphalaria glabrata]